MVCPLQKRGMATAPSDIDRAKRYEKSLGVTNLKVNKPPTENRNMDIVSLELGR